MKKEVKL